VKVLFTLVLVTDRSHAAGLFRIFPLKIVLFVFAICIPKVLVPPLAVMLLLIKVLLFPPCRDIPVLTLLVPFVSILFSEKVFEDPPTLRPEFKRLPVVFISFCVMVLLFDEDSCIPVLSVVPFVLMVFCEILFQEELVIANPT